MEGHREMSLQASRIDRRSLGCLDVGGCCCLGANHDTFGDKWAVGAEGVWEISSPPPPGMARIGSPGDVELRLQSVPLGRTAAHSLINGKRVGSALFGHDLSLALSGKAA